MSVELTAPSAWPRDASVGMARDISELIKDAVVDADRLIELSSVIDRDFSVPIAVEMD